jgi:ABC-type microcin C transport system permease subunit YejE
VVEFINSLDFNSYIIGVAVGAMMGMFVNYLMTKLTGV